jgi:hypothetical protein
MLDQLPQTEQELEALRNVVMTKEGLLVSVFDILRKVPRRVLMVFKLNDLTRYYLRLHTVHDPIDEASPQKSGPRIIYDTLEGGL